MAKKIDLFSTEDKQIKCLKQIIKINDTETFIVYDYYSEDGKEIENSMIHNVSGELITSDDTGGVFIADIYNFLDDLDDNYPGIEKIDPEAVKK